MSEEDGEEFGWSLEGWRIWNWRSEAEGKLVKHGRIVELGKVELD
jgi:hypothetical protein